MTTYSDKIISREQALLIRKKLADGGKKVAFTNGCFDLVHAGHVSTISFARSQGDILILGINSDASVKRLKGPDRPMVSERNRAALLAAFEAVDYVVLFDETEVLPLIKELKPDVLIKGQDREGNVVGQDFVQSYGGRVAIAPMVQGLSTTDIIRKVLETYGHQAR